MAKIKELSDPFGPKHCGHGSTISLCPWHYKSHMPLALQRNILTYAHHVSKVHNADLQAISGGVCSHLSIQVPSPSQDGLYSLIHSWKSFHSCHSPWEQHRSSHHWPWQSPLLTHTIVEMHNVCDGNMDHCCWPVSQLENVICLLVLFQEKKSIFIWLVGQPAYGWPLLANFVAGSQADYQMLEAADDGNGHCMVLSTCHRCHIGHQIFGCHGCYHSYLKEWPGL